MNSDRIKSFVVPKLKFASTGLISTLLDYVVVFVLLDLMDFRVVKSLLGIDLELANTIGTACGMICNFILQKKYVFNLSRGLFWAICLSFGFSLLSFILNQFLFDFLRDRVIWLSQHTFATKVLVTGAMFLFNFYTKRFSFGDKHKKSASSSR